MIVREVFIKVLPSISHAFEFDLSKPPPPEVVALRKTTL